MYSAKELYQALNQAFPSSLSCKWDNDGAMCMSDPERPIQKVLLTLDVTQASVDHAIKTGCDAIVSHHPLIFSPMRSINGCDVKSRVITKLMRGGISAFSFHTRLDAVSGGVNDVLCRLLGIEDAEDFLDEGIPLARIGTVPSCKAIDLAQKIRDTLGAQGVTVTLPEKEITKVVVVGGGGKDLIDSAIDSFADCLITGEVSYNAQLDASDSGLSIICAGHFFTENPVLSFIEKKIKEFDNTIEVTYFNSNLIQHI